MKIFILPLSAVLCFLWTTERAFGVPVPNDGGTGREYSDTNDYIIVDDMIIQRDESRAGFVNRAWPNLVVPYAYHGNITAPRRRNVSQAMVRISRISCITFRPATRQDRYNLRFINNPDSPGCRSTVGWSNIRNQDVQLSPKCSDGNIV